MVLRANGRVHLPRRWRALHYEETEQGTIVWAERRGLVEMAIDALEDPFRRWVWPYLTGGKR